MLDPPADSAVRTPPTTERPIGSGPARKIEIYFTILLCNGLAVAVYLLLMDTLVAMFLIELPHLIPGSSVDRKFADEALQIFGQRGAIRAVTHFLVVAPIVVISVLGMREVAKLARQVK